MAVTSSHMPLAFLFFFLMLGMIMCDGQYSVLFSPKSLSFVPSSQKISTQDIPKVMSANMGLALRENVDWDGSRAGNLLQRPNANVFITVDSRQGIDFKAAHNYGVINDGDSDTSNLVSSLRSSAFKTNPLVVDFSLDKTALEVRSEHPKLFPSLIDNLAAAKDLFEHRNVAPFNISRTSDLTLLAELEIMTQISNELSKSPLEVKDDVPDHFHFRITGLRLLDNEHGQKSAISRAGSDKVVEVVTKVTEDFKKIYQNNVVVQVLTAESKPALLVRKTRSLMAEDAKAAEDTLSKKVNVAPNVRSDYTAFFQIILWTMVLLTVMTFGITLGFWNMDPGRDSLIYRLTSQRTKKD